MTPNLCYVAAAMSAEAPPSLAGLDSRARPFTVLIGDFDALLLRGLTETLGDDQRIRVLCAGVQRAQLEKAVKREQPNVLIVGEDVHYSLLARLRARRPSLGVLVLARAQSLLSRSTLFAAGVAHVTFSDSPEDLLRAVRSAAQERNVPHARSQSWDTAALTGRETEVFDLLRQDCRQREIAEALHIAPSTVKTHVAQIKRKLGVSHKRDLEDFHISNQPDE
jgi:DNA-binding NarL/FixJ family response regulator